MPALLIIPTAQHSDMMCKAAVNGSEYITTKESLSRKAHGCVLFLLQLSVWYDTITMLHHFHNNIIIQWNNSAYHLSYKHTASLEAYTVKNTDSTSSEAYAV